jgi:hypothetical protein
MRFMYSGSAVPAVSFEGSDGFEVVPSDVVFNTITECRVVRFMGRRECA